MHRHYYCKGSETISVPTGRILSLIALGPNALFWEGTYHKQVTRLHRIAVRLYEHSNLTQGYLRGNANRISPFLARDRLIVN